jgi:hypothetical protein
MALMDAKEYDPRPAQRRLRILGLIVVVAVAIVAYKYFTRYDSEIGTINKFFAALEQKDFEKAYGLYNGDPDWKQHPQKYSNYNLGQFTLDWGPSGEYGPITSHRVDCALAPPKKDFVTPSGVVVVVTINNRAEPRSMWVEKKNKSITDSPIKVQCHGAQ